MLAVVGFLLTQYVHLPGDQFQAGPLDALTTVPAGAQAQVFTCESPSLPLPLPQPLMLPSARHWCCVLAPSSCFVLCSLQCWGFL